MDGSRVHAALLEQFSKSFREVHHAQFGDFLSCGSHSSLFVRWFWCHSHVWIKAQEFTQGSHGFKTKKFMNMIDTHLLLQKLNSAPVALLDCESAVARPRFYRGRRWNVIWLKVRRHVEDELFVKEVLSPQLGFGDSLQMKCIIRQRYGAFEGRCKKRHSFLAHITCQFLAQAVCIYSLLVYLEKLLDIEVAGQFFGCITELNHNALKFASSKKFVNGSTFFRSTRVGSKAFCNFEDCLR